jgi:hypothetical protein
MTRSRSSEYLRSCQHDVPWTEPELVRIVLTQALRTKIHRLVRTLLERYLPIIVGALVRLGLVGGDMEAIHPPVSPGEGRAPL